MIVLGSPTVVLFCHLGILWYSCMRMFFSQILSFQLVDWFSDQQSIRQRNGTDWAVASNLFFLPGKTSSFSFTCIELTPIVFGLCPVIYTLSPRSHSLPLRTSTLSKWGSVLLGGVSSKVLGRHLRVWTLKVMLHNSFYCPQNRAFGTEMR